MCKVEDQNFLKSWSNVDAKKSALGMLSPFQMKDFQFAYAQA